MVFLLLGINQQTTIRVHEKFSSIIHISEYVVSSVHTIFFFLLHSILLDLWKINQLLLCFRGFVRNIFATFNRNKNPIWFLSQSFQMKRFFLLVYWSTAAASPPIGWEAGARPPVGWRPGAETGPFLASHMFATLSLIKCMGAAERFIEIWRNWKMEQFVMYCIDGHEREAQSLNLNKFGRNWASTQDRTTVWKDIYSFCIWKLVYEWSILCRCDTEVLLSEEFN